MLLEKTAKVVGGGNEAWGQTFSENGFFIVLEINGLLEPAILGRSIINSLKNSFETKEKIDLQFIKNAVYSLPLNENVHLLIAYKTYFSAKDVLYLAGFGNVEAWMKRNDKTAVLLKDTSFSSGFLKDKDFLMLVTPAFKKLFSLSDFDRLNSNHHCFSDHEEKLAAIIRSEKESDGSAALLVSFIENEEDKPLPEPKLNILNKLRAVKEKTRFATEEEKSEEVNISKKKKVTISVGLLLLIVIIISLFFGNYQKTKLKNEQILTTIKDNVLEKISQGKALSDLNPNQARKHLLEAKAIIENSLSQFAGKTSQQEAEAERLLNEVNEALIMTEKVFKISEAALFFDLSWIKENAKGKSLALYKDSLVVLDSENGKVYHLFLESKKSELLSSGDLLRNGKKITAAFSSSYILVEDNGRQMVIDEKLQTVLENDPEWEKIIDLASFGGNLYLLDKSGKIWKYQGSDSGFGSKKNYLPEDASLELSDTSSFKIDGSVWVLNQNDIFKFTGGVLDNFNLDKSAVSSLNSFFIDDQTEEIYFKSNNTLVSFDKEGAYKSRYEWDQLNQAQDFVVAANLEEILVLIDSKIYVFDLKT